MSVNPASLLDPKRSPSVMRTDALYVPSGRAAPEESRKSHANGKEALSRVNTVAPSILRMMSLEVSPEVG